MVLFLVAIAQRMKDKTLRPGVNLLAVLLAAYGVSLGRCAYPDCEPGACAALVWRPQLDGGSWRGSHSVAGARLPNSPRFGRRIGAHFDRDLIARLASQMAIPRCDLTLHAALHRGRSPGETAPALLTAEKLR